MPAAGRLPAYLIALSIGLAGCGVLLPAETVAGGGALWRFPSDDLAQNLTGHLAVQHGEWRWPVLFASDLAWPHGLSVALTDSNPFATLLAKTFAPAPTNLMGVWLLACFVLQPVAAVFALRSLRVAGPGPGPQAWEAALAASVLAISFPALLYRAAHINLLGQFLLLFALGLTVRICDAPAPRRWVAAGLVLLMAAFSHPYLFVFAACLLAAVPLDALLRRRDVLRPFAAFIVAAALPPLLLRLSSGTLGSNGSGYGHFSMNLLSPVWPQHSGLFGAGLPVLDATGGQYEGFCYLGAGGLLLIVAAAVLRWPPSSRLRGLAVVLVGLTLLALSPLVYAGPVLLQPFRLRPVEQVFNLIPSAGRAFWAVGYALLLGSVAVLSGRLRRRVLVPLLLVALGLQLADTAPFVRDARAYFAGARQAPTPIDMPGRATLAGVYPLCTQSTEGDLLRLLALRDGARLRNMRASRSPVWFNCESDRSDALETPIERGELRVFLPGLRPSGTIPFGAGAECRVQNGFTLCAKGLHVAGEPLPEGAPPPTLPLGVALSGEVLGSALSAYWTPGPDGTAWSEGPRATLLFRTDPSARTLHLRLAGVARTAGGTRTVGFVVGTAPVPTMDLPDGEVRDVALPLTGAGPDGIVRIAFDIFRPVDPSARGMQAPVRRVGMRLLEMRLDP